MQSVYGLIALSLHIQSYSQTIFFYVQARCNQALLMLRKIVLETISIGKPKCKALKKDGCISVVEETEGGGGGGGGHLHHTSRYFFFI